MNLIGFHIEFPGSIPLYPLAIILYYVKHFVHRYPHPHGSCIHDRENGFEQIIIFKITFSAYLPKYFTSPDFLKKKKPNTSLTYIYF